MNYRNGCLRGVLAFLIWNMVGWCALPPDSVTQVFTSMSVEGDAELVTGLADWAEWSQAVVGHPVSSSDLEEFRLRVLGGLQEAGYLFAQVELRESEAADVLVVKVSGGQLGEFAIRRHGRHYSPRQIIAKLSGRGSTFNYAEFCRRLAAANSGDLKIDVTLKPTYRNSQLAVDVEVDYEDSLPLHGSLELCNAAAPEAKSSLQLRGGVQMLNLARCDDVLSLHYVTNGDVGGEVNAIYGAYQLPLGERCALTLFGSWSDSAYDEVFRDLDILGRGYSCGFQWEQELYQDRRRRLAMLFGWRFASTRNRLRLLSELLEQGKAQVSMPFLGIAYSDLLPDIWNGRNFASLRLSGNRAGMLGASETDAFRAEGRGADGTFWQTRLTAARLQRLFSGEESPGKWTLFLQWNALYSSEAVPNACRDYLGGFETVRGYQEAETSGDTLLHGSLELRTPLIGREPAEAGVANAGGRCHLQGILFTDFGLVANHDDNLPENGRPRHCQLISAGAGLRLGWGDSLQVALDYALPLRRHATPDTPSHGRWHFAVRLSF